MSAQRVVTTVVAVCVLVVMAIGLRDTRLVAGALTDGGKDPRGAIADLERARLLNPDPSADLTRAIFLNGQGEHDAAIETLLSIVRREPANRDAWRFIATLSSERDPALAARAQAAIARLDPLGAKPG